MAPPTRAPAARRPGQRPRHLLVLSGGGALGAFEVGVWKALAPVLQAAGQRVDWIVGSSIGALNGALIARHAQAADHGVAALEDFWRRELSTPPWPFLPWPGRWAGAWNGVLTGFVAGNRALYQPQPWTWQPWAAWQRTQLPPYDTTPMHRSLADHIGEVPPEAEGVPRVTVRTLDVASGDPRDYDNREAPLQPAQLVASASMPLLFPTTEWQGQTHVDGDFSASSLIDATVQALHEGDTPVRLIVVDLFPHRQPGPPESGLQTVHRLTEVLQGGKLRDSLRMLQTLGARRLDDDEGRDAPTPLADTLARVELLRIGREALPHEHVSGLFDYSPDRIDALIEQGRTNTEAALARLDW